MAVWRGRLFELDGRQSANFFRLGIIEQVSQYLRVGWSRPAQIAD